MKWCCGSLGQGCSLASGGPDRTRSGALPDYPSHFPALSIFEGILSISFWIMRRAYARYITSVNVYIYK
jgi:hypothetical protein